MSYGVKICLLGDGGVGKTSIRRNYLGLNFSVSYIETIGADFAKKVEKIGDSELIFQIWDLAGQDRYANVRPLYYTGVRGALIVYDVTRPESLNNVLYWIEELLSNNITFIPIVLIGNKSDLLPELDQNHKDTVNALTSNIRKALRLKKDMPIYSIETSAKTGENIQKAFKLLGECVLKDIKKNLR